MAWPVTFNGRTYTANDFLGTSYVEGLPDLMQDAATHFANGYVGSSTTSVSVGTGTKTLTVEPNKLFAPGQPVVIASVANPTTVYMDGRVTSYNPSTGVLVVNVAVVLGSGTLASWSVTIGGARVSTTLPVAISEGGHGGTSAAQGLTNLGITAVAQTFLGQATQTLLRTAGLGFTSFGETLIALVDAAAARTALGISSAASTLVAQTTQAAMRTAGLGLTALGDSLVVAASAAAARTTLGSSATGDALFTTASAAAARTTLGFSNAVVQIVETSTTSAATGTTIIPGDNTKPQSSEGDEYLTLTITPKSSTNILHVEFLGFTSHSVTDVVVTAALFKDSDTDSIFAGLHYANSAKVLPLLVKGSMVAGTTSAITFKIRIGGSVAGTTYLNRNITGNLLGGVLCSSLRITETTP